MAYTLLQLQQMGATPVTSNASAQGANYTQDQLTQMGAVPQNNQKQDSGFNLGDVANSVKDGVYNFGKDYVNAVGKTWAETPKNIANDVNSGAADMQKALNNNSLTSIPSAGDVGDTLKGAAKATVGTASDAINAIFAPITGLITASTKNISDLASESPTVQSIATSGFGDNVQKAQDAVSQIQKQYPGATKMLNDVFNVVAGLVGERVAPGDMTQTGTDLAQVKNNISNTVDSVKAGINNTADNIKTTLTKSPMSENDIYQAKLKTAQDAIYTKLSPTEKATVPLTDSSIMKTSTPDMLQNPQSKPIIEAVANLPEDIQIKPNDSIAIKESKLQQGATRLHQDTDNYLYTQKTQTSFNDARYNSYIKKNFLDEKLKEFGADSVEYKAAQEIANKGKSLIESNDAHGVYTGRQAFNAAIEKDYPTTFKRAKGSFGNQLDPRTTAITEAAREYPQIQNKFIADELLGENNPYSARLKQESSLITAKEQMRARSVGDIGKGKIGQYLKKHPIIKEAVKVGEKVLPLGGVLKVTEHL